MECGEPETESVDVEKVAMSGLPPFKVPVPSVVAPSLKVTLPVGMPLAVDVTVAVNVTVLP